jgi:phage host-nuclease inhibitor protein Gam
MKSETEVLEIGSVESLDATVAETVALKRSLAVVFAKLEEKKAKLDKDYAPGIGKLHALILERETAVQEYCEANRTSLFTERKSRETNAAVIGFEWTPYRVETSSRKIKWGDVVKRLRRLKWGKAYVRQPEPKVDKESLLADREKLSPVQRLAAGISFEQDEQFFIRPKSEVAEPTVVKEAA